MKVVGESGCGLKVPSQSLPEVVRKKENQDGWHLGLRFEPGTSKIQVGKQLAPLNFVSKLGKVCH
jgi:hypothetical protein